MGIAIRLWALIGVGAMLLTPAAGATTPPTHWQPLEALSAIAERTVRAAQPSDGYRRVVRAQRLDPRLKLQACAETPTAAIRDPGRRPGAYRTVSLQCEAPVVWTAYIRVALETYAEVIIARRPLARGQRLLGEDLYLEERRIDQLPYGWFHRHEELVGRPTLRPVAAGAVVTPSNVGHSHDIVAGQEVLLKASSSGVAVGMPGEALEDGSRGELIRVRNLRSQVVVEGVIRSAKVVEVLLE
ncbi:MAG: flagellar basal body P-ring formation chaperone FlgA [Pseudomonadota bacterium]